jgi:hypothetical protein
MEVGQGPNWDCSAKGGEKKEYNEDDGGVMKIDLTAGYNNDAITTAMVT